MGRYDQNDNVDLRISFLLKEVDEAKLKKVLQQREKRRTKEKALRDIFEFFIAAASDLIRQLREPAVSPESLIPMLTELRDMTNDALAAVTKRFSCKKYIIGPAWTVNDNAMVE
jgi:hypothetical protein